MFKTGIILAAGQGTRMKSKVAKVLHKICGKSLVEHVLRALEPAIDDKPIVVVGNCAEQVMEKLEGKAYFALQAERKGTGHAVMMAKDYLIGKEGYVVVCAGDMPLIKAQTLKNLMDYTVENNLSACVLTALVDNPAGYGRIIRKDGKLLKIVEQKDANDEEKLVNEVNTSVYCFNIQDLLSSLDKLQPNNAQGELYLTDTIGILKAEGKAVDGYACDDVTEAMGINDRIQLSQAQAIMQKQINEKLMLQGVTIVNPENTYIDADVVIGQDTVVYPNCAISGNTVIGSGCEILYNCKIDDCVIGDNVTIQASTLIKAKVADGTTVGPYAYLRPGANIGKKARIGDFVEIKNATIGDGSKVSHLAYVGDATIGKDCNIGCGVVFVNYDGKHKFRSTVGDNVFVGSNSNLIAPVNLEDGAYIAAGSTINKDVPGGALAIARARQEVKPGWAAAKRQEWQKEEK